MSVLDRIFGSKKSKGPYMITGRGEDELDKRSRSDPDTSVLTALQRDGSQTTQSLSRSTSLTPDQVEKSLRRLESMGLIEPARNDGIY